MAAFLMVAFVEARSTFMLSMRALTSIVPRPNSSTAVAIQLMDSLRTCRSMHVFKHLEANTGFAIKLACEQWRMNAHGECAARLSSVLAM